MEDVRERKPYNDRLARILFIPLLCIFGLLFVTFFVAYSPFRVAGPSMLPTLHEGDRLLVTRGYKRPIRGDVIVFQMAEGNVSEELVKRVIAIPGDWISTRDDHATVNGRLESASGLLVGSLDPPTPQVLVPAGFIFVMGDNRADSMDSRDFGLVPLTAVRGRAVAVFSPVTRIRRIRSTHVQ